MKIKSLAIFFLILGLSISTTANSSINDVEYLAGKDFVQLRFITNEIIPIPDLFYPQKDNYELIVMRLNDIDFLLQKDKLEFDSPIIRHVNVVRKDTHTDLEIQLKEKVNYRLFTNPNGLYIEFPNNHKTRYTKKTKIVKAEPKAAPQDKNLQTAVPGKSVIRDIQIAQKSDEKIEFEILLSKSAPYKVIPIPDAPARLAIDLQDTNSRIIKKRIKQLNVRSLRGAYNSPSVFRLVFDLDYLKGYQVSRENNVLRVSFFDSDKKNANRNKPEVVLAKKSPAPKPQSTPEEIKPENTVPPIKATADHEEVVAAKPMADTQAPTEFFTEEKSNIDPQNPPKEYVNIQNSEGAETTFVKQTLDANAKQYEGEMVDFIFKDADLINVLKFIARTAGLNMMIDPGVSGKVTSELYQVPWDQALELFLKVNDLSMVDEGNILRIGRVDKLAKEAEQRRKLREAKEMEGNLVTHIRALSYSKGKDILKILQKQLTQRGEILVDDRSNTLIITEVPEKIKLLDTLIDTLDTPNRQVSIEARIVETSGNYEESFGIQWGYNMIADASYGNQTTLKFPNSVRLTGDTIANDQNPGMPSTLPGGGYAINLPAGGRTSGTTISLGNVANTFRLDLALSAMEKKGKAKIISAPKTTTQNNTEANLVQGQQIPIQTIQNNTITVRYINAALEMRVTPQITAEGTIIMTLNIKNNAADFGNLVNNIPPITTQSIETTVQAKDGGTIVIGGMYRVEDSTTNDSVPLLSKIPIFGNLFKNSSKFGRRRELLIFITPRIIK
jgi:type IV pilus assembly protein PilQ